MAKLTVTFEYDSEEVNKLNNKARGYIKALRVENAEGVEVPAVVILAFEPVLSEKLWLQTEELILGDKKGTDFSRAIGKALVDLAEKVKE